MQRLGGPGQWEAEALQDVGRRLLRETTGWCGQDEAPGPVPPSRPARLSPQVTTKGSGWEREGDGGGTR